ncbi:MAG: alpha/beta hydrolase [Spirochaeta sp.]
MAQPLRVYARENIHTQMHCILLHGFGANAQDLMGLSVELDTKIEMDYLFPEAPYKISMGGMGYGNAWFPRNDDEVTQALTGDYFVGLSRLDPPGLETSGDEILSFISESGLDWSKLIIGGFSQGAMVAAEAVLRAPEPPAALVLLSGGLVAHHRWEGLAAELPDRWGKDISVPLFQSHGIQDPILDVVGAEALYEILTASVFDGGFHSFAGGHTIPLDTMAELTGFLASVIK